jgi:hypothetical protein
MREYKFPRSPTTTAPTAVTESLLEKYLEDTRLAENNESVRRNAMDDREHKM